jgi:hypothetical protein
MVVAVQRRDARGGEDRMLATEAAAVEIDGEMPLPLLERRVLDRQAGLQVAGVVDRHVESAVAGQHLADRALPVRLSADVELEERGGRAEPRGRLRATRRTDPREDHRRAPRRELRRDRRPDAAVAPGDQHRPAVEIVHGAIRPQTDRPVTPGAGACRHAGATPRRQRPAGRRRKARCPLSGGRKSTTLVPPAATLRIGA